MLVYRPASRAGTPFGSSINARFILFRATPNVIFHVCTADAGDDRRAYRRSLQLANLMKHSAVIHRA